jgi:uncharacterized protein
MTIDFNHEDSNTSDNPHFDQVMHARLSRRGLLRGAASSAAVMGLAPFAPLALSGCGGGGNDAGAAPLLAFTAVAKGIQDAVVVPAGYSAQVIYALGDPLRATTPTFRNDGTDADFENRAGDHHDGMEWFGLSAAGEPSRVVNDRGLLAVNHEATTDELRSSFFIHPNGGTATLPRPAAEVDKETAIHGVSVVEVRRSPTGEWSYVRDSAANFRVTALSDVDIAGPGRGHASMVTRFSPTGVATRGTLNNCGTGKTPWGTFLTGEENWFGYFFRSATDDAARANDKSVTSLRRYGRAQGAASRHGWETAGSEDRFARWNNSQLGASANGADDYRNEMNTMGYIVEIDPYTKSRKPVKRTALGRFAHESAAFSAPVVGQPLSVYMGDDARNEYIYKYVSNAIWSAADANPADRLATGAKFLDSGKLYVAKFNDDGTGQWIELALTQAAIRTSTTYAFADQADVCVNARLAADAVGATKMDRPEWCAVHPQNGEIYFSLTNNSNRRVDPSSSTQLRPDAANPRAYSDVRGTTTQNGNVNGHVLRVKEGASGSAATAFTWDLYLTGAEALADANRINLSSLTAEQDFSSPDGLVYSQATGICWIQTDDGAYTDVTNCMMLAAVPGQVGDGARRTLSYTRTDGTVLNVTTPVGKAPTPSTLKRFLVGPKDCEITGFCETPDGQTMFVNIQHPGEGTLAADVNDPSKYTSQWPANAGYGAGRRPRSATIVITKNDGGMIGT